MIALATIPSFVAAYRYGHVTLIYPIESQKGDRHEKNVNDLESRSTPD